MDLKAFKAIWEVSARSEIALIIAILTIFKLNTTKLLNFVDLSKAILLYVEDAKSTSENFSRKLVEVEIFSIKESMNKKK